MMTDEQALVLAAKHGLKTGPAAPTKQVADFVRAIYKEGRDQCVMTIDSRGHRTNKKKF